MARANVPKFGDWGSDGDVPYTVYFDKARKNKGGKMINPNDPQENPEMFSNHDLLPQAPPSRPPSRAEEPGRRTPTRPTTGSRLSREEADYKQFSNSPARAENMGQRTVNDSSYGGRGARSSRPARSSGGSEYNIDRSPLHPQYQPKVTGRGSATASPAWEGNNSYDSSHGTPGRSRLRPVSRVEESPDRGAAVPKFGEWDENNPESAENFTHIFNKVREERNTGPTNVSGTPKHPSYGMQTRDSKQKPKKCGCFPWW